MIVAPRLANHKALVEDNCPGALAELERFRLEHRSAVGGWPDWCWGRLASRRNWLAIVAHPGSVRTCSSAWPVSWHPLVRGARGWVSTWSARSSPQAPRRPAGRRLVPVPGVVCYVALRPIPGMVGAYIRLDWDRGSTARYSRSSLTWPKRPSRRKACYLTSTSLWTTRACLPPWLNSSTGQKGCRETHSAASNAGTSSGDAICVDLALYLCSLEADVVATHRHAPRPGRQVALSREPLLRDVGYRVAELLRRRSGSNTTQSSARLKPQPASETRSFADFGGSRRPISVESVDPFRGFSYTPAIGEPE